MNKAVGKILHDPTRNVRVGSTERASLQGEPRLLPRRTPLSKGIACRLKLCASPDGACALGTHRDAAEARDAEPAGGACPGVHLGLERNAAKRAVRPVARDCGDARRLGSVHARKFLDDLRGKRAHRREKGFSVIFITHDLPMLLEITDKIAVMKDGVIVEQGVSEDVYFNPQHPYTQRLLSSFPSLTGDRGSFVRVPRKK